MAKQQDIPKELREFNKIFERLSYRHDYSIVFDDFLTICMGYFGAETMNTEWQQALTRYDEKEKDLIRELFQCMIHTLNKIFTEQDLGWYDFFGHFYEVLASKGKKSALGQFFTPESLCDLMTKLQYADGIVGKTINDPTCGSGRTLLSFHAAHPGNTLIGQDIDMVCCKMAALNFMFHGCKGEVVCMDTLANGNFLGAWSINPRIYTYSGMPHIIKIDNMEQTHIYKMWQLSIF